MVLRGRTCTVLSYPLARNYRAKITNSIHVRWAVVASTFQATLFFSFRFASSVLLEDFYSLLFVHSINFWCLTFATKIIRAYLGALNIKLMFTCSFTSHISLRRCQTPFVRYIDESAHPDHFLFSFYTCIKWPHHTLLIESKRPTVVSILAFVMKSFSIYSGF